MATEKHIMYKIAKFAYKSDVHNQLVDERSEKCLR